MTISTEVERTVAAEVLQALAADWRSRTMPDDVQVRFDMLARDLEAYDAEMAARPTPARIEPESPPLAAKFRGLRDIHRESDRAVAIRDMQELAADWRARSMSYEAQFAFDALVHAIEAYDASCVRKASAGIPVDPRDSVIAAMRVAASGGSPW